MNRLLLFLILCIASTHLAFGQYYDTYNLQWGGGKYFEVKSYGGEYSQPDYMILLLGSNRMKEAEWRITATVKSVESVYNNVVKDPDFPVNMLNLMLTSKHGSSNIPVGNFPNMMMVWSNLQGLNNEVELVTFQSLNQDGYHQLYLNFELHVMGGEYLKKIPIRSKIQFTFEYKLYSRSQSNQPWEHEMTFVNNDSHFDVAIPSHQVPVYSISVSPEVLLEFNSITGYMNGVEKTSEKGLKVTAAGNYEVRVKSQTSEFTSTTSSRTLPLELVSLQLSGGNGAKQAIDLSQSNKLIIDGNSIDGKVVEYNMIYKAKPIEDRFLYISEEQTYSTNLMFELITK